MRAATIFVAALCSLSSGCGQAPVGSTVGGRDHGRYAGIGVFETGRLWSHMSVTNESQDPAAAKIADDEHIIVVVDSHTGEVRQCGDHSGYCVRMNPWNGTASAVPALPAKLVKHAADLAAEDKVENTGRSD